MTTPSKPSACNAFFDAIAALSETVTIPRADLPTIEILDEDTALIDDEFPVNISGDTSSERFTQAHYHLAIALALQEIERGRVTAVSVTDMPLAEAA